jgi:capsular polysaccharide transport system permease protein
MSISTRPAQSSDAAATTRLAEATMIQRQYFVIVALMLRIIRTRFFGHGLGFLISIGWPLVHILALLAIHAWADRAAPYGTSLALFFATALVPYMTFSYMSRSIMISVVHNRPLLFLPGVTITDLIIAGGILEALSACCMIILLSFVLAAFGIDFVPKDALGAASAFGAAMLLGFGVGFVNSILVLATPTWVTGYSLILIGLYIMSGVFFVLDSFSEHIRYPLSFLPTLQLTEWMRAAYYDGYGSTLDRTYTVGSGVVFLALGLVFERLFRGRLLIPS